MNAPAPTAPAVPPQAPERVLLSRSEIALIRAVRKARTSGHVVRLAVEIDPGGMTIWACGPGERIRDRG